MVNEDRYKKYDENKLSENFFLDNETLTLVKDFMKKYDRYNFNESIIDLINLGLTNLGYYDKERILERFTFKGDSPNIDIFTMPTEPEKVVFEIIKFLSQKSIDRNAHRTQILLEARTKGLSSSKTTQLLDRLIRNGEIYEPQKDCFKLIEY
jgi:hypothetical protein